MKELFISQEQRHTLSNLLIGIQKVFKRLSIAASGLFTLFRRINRQSRLTYHQ
jgi:hypothetical protein